MLSWNQLITAAIVAFVVIVSLKAGGGIVEAANKVTSIVGVELVQPSVKSFTATPESGGNMRFQLSLGGEKSDVELLIYQRYAPTPENELGVPDLKENPIYKLIAEGTGAKLVTVAPKGVVEQTCPKETGSKGCETTDVFKPGGYRFGAVLKKKGKVVDSKDTTIGFYDESYVEMLHTPVFRCKDFNFHDCNVIECKKELINKNLLDPGSAFPLELRRQSGILRKISDEFRNEKGFSTPNDCGKVGDVLGNVASNDKDLKASHFVLKGCSDKDIDDLNIKVARARLLESAYEDSVHRITSEDKYSASLTRIDFWKERAVEMTMSCTVPLGGPDPKSHWLNAPFGAHTALAKLNWQFVPSDSTPKLWKSKVNAELDKVLNSKLRPVITDAASGTNSDMQIALVWKLQIGKDALTRYQLKLFYGSAAVKETLSEAKKLAGAKKLPLLEIALPKQPAKDDVSLKYPEVSGLTSSQMGTYWFELTAFDSTGQSSVVDVHTGMYGNSYIELYRDVKDVNDACGSGCDVVGKKEAALGNDKIWSYTQQAFGKRKSGFQASCHLELSKKGEARISGCLPSEVDVLYRDAVTAYVVNLPSGAIQLGKTVADLLKFDCWKETWMNNYQSRYVDTGIKAVCDAKGNLKKSLDELEWGYTGS